MLKSLHTSIPRIAISTIVAIASIMGFSPIPPSNAQYSGIYKSMAECNAVGQALIKSGKYSFYRCTPLPGRRAPSSVERMKYPTGISSHEGSSIVQSIRNSLRIRGRNIAIAEANINGQRQLLTGVSGRVSPPQTVPSPANPLFKTRDSGAMTRAFDSEVKILEDIARNLPANAKGTISLYTERVACFSCREVIQQFQAKFPNIKVIITHGQ
jgi:hypothetical protein